MDQIIAGRFPTKAEADVAAAGMADYVATNDICIFHNNAPGQHGVHPGGDDEHSDPGAREAQSPHTSAVAGLTVEGLLARRSVVHWSVWQRRAWRHIPVHY